MNKINLKRIWESRFTQFLILGFLIFMDIVLISVNVIFVYTDGILFLFLSFLIAYYNSWLVIYCITFKGEMVNKQIV